MRFRTHVSCIVALIFIVASTGASSEVLEKKSNHEWGDSGSRDTTRCYFAGRWITRGLGNANFEVNGSVVQGVARTLSLAAIPELIEYQIRARIEPDGKSATGKVQIIGLTGVMPGPRMTTNARLTLSSKMHFMILEVDGLWGVIEDRMQKVGAGKCQ